MKYFNNHLDDLGYSHSIDKVIIDYWLKCDFKIFTDELLSLLSHYEFDREKQCKLDVKPSHRYSFYTNIIWCNGFMFSIGKYSDYDKEAKKWRLFDRMRVEVNPNKHGDELFLDEVMKLIKLEAGHGELVRYDYAIDIPVSPGSVSVIGSRKEKGLYKGTRYYGQRHKHGYLKVYDKAREQCLESDMTRIEYTYDAKMIPSWEKIVIHSPVDSDLPASQLPGTAKLYLDMLQEIKALNGDMEPFLERLTHRMYKQIEPYLFTGVELQLDQTILDCLLNKINDMFIISDSNEYVNESEEFLTDFRCSIPFD